MGRRKRPGSEKQAIAAEKFALDTAALAKKLLGLRALLGKIIKQYEAAGNPSETDQARVRSLLSSIKHTKEKLAKRGVSEHIIENSKAIEAALEASKVRPVRASPRPGGVGLYGLGQAKKTWR